MNHSTMHSIVNHVVEFMSVVSSVGSCGTGAMLAWLAGRRTRRRRGPAFQLGTSPIQRSSRLSQHAPQGVQEPRRGVRADDDGHHEAVHNQDAPTYPAQHRCHVRDDSAPCALSPEMSVWRKPHTKCLTAPHGASTIARPCAHSARPNGSHKRAHTKTHRGFCNLSVGMALDQNLKISPHVNFDLVHGGRTRWLERDLQRLH